MHSEPAISPFAGLSGQARAKALLSRSLSSGRIAHAYLFRGPDGVGKKLFAGAMARALNCRTAGPTGVCDHCPSCRKFLSGSHPDLVVEAPENGTIKIERMRQLYKSLSYAPYESERRIVIIEDIHTMRTEAANSLLKTLEEPPADNVLVLTAETAKNVLPTISSRCQIVPFFALSEKETAAILQQKLDIDEERASLLARLAEGSPGQAVLLQQSGVLETWRAVRQILGDKIYREDSAVGTVLQVAQQMADLKDNLIPLLGLLRLWLRDLLLDAAEKKEEGTVGSAALFAKLEAVNRAEQELARNCNRSLVCEILLFRLQ